MMQIKNLRFYDKCDCKFKEQKNPLQNSYNTVPVPLKLTNFDDTKKS